MYKLLYLAVWVIWYIGSTAGAWNLFPSIFIVLPIFGLIFYLAPKTDEWNELE